MADITKEELPSLLGCTDEELNAFMKTTFGAQTLDFLAQWATVTQKALKANRAVVDACLITDDEGHILCRFCGEGIPNWKEENAREHSSDCPINLVTEALISTKGLRVGILGLTNSGTSQSE